MHNLGAKVDDAALPWYIPLLTLLGSLRESSKAIKLCIELITQMTN